MKIHAFILLVAMSVSAAVIAADAPPPVSASSVDELEAPALAALSKSKKDIVQLERFIAERIYGKEKAEIYIKYFMQGLDSKTGAIMIEGGENQWLEIAFARGYTAGVTFMIGYRHGRSDGR